MTKSTAVLVTGATGLLGSHLLVRLCHKQKNAKIIGLKRAGSNLEETKRVFSYYPDIDDSLFDKIEWRTADMLDRESLQKALKGIDQIYHCAAIVSFDSKDKEQLIKTNIQSTKNLIEAITHRHSSSLPGITLLHVSSTSALGDDQDSLINESSPRDPKRRHSGYSVSKYESEKIVQQAIANGQNATILNPGIILGPGFWDKGSSMLFTKVWDGLRFYTKGGTGYVDIRDLTDLMLRMMAKLLEAPHLGHDSLPSPISPEQPAFETRSSPISPEQPAFEHRYCVVGFNSGFREFFNSVADNLHKARPSIKAGRLLSGIAWRIDTLRARLSGSNPLITRETAESAQRRQYYSSDKILNALDGKFKFRAMEETIQWICSNFKADGSSLHDTISSKITSFITAHHVATLATTTGHQVWIAHCFYTFLDKEQVIVFTTDDDTRHGKEMHENNRVAIGIVLETKTVGEIRGLQIEGRAVRLDPAGKKDKQLYKVAKKAYLRRFPYAVLMKTSLWAVKPATIKMTDNRLGFGKKLLWKKRDARGNVTPFVTPP